MLSVKNLSVGYDEQVAISDINFTLLPTQKLALIGASGSGKSATLKTIAGILEPLAGQIILKDKLVAYLGQFNELNLALPLSVKDFVITSQYAKVGLFGKISSDDLQKVKQAMEFLEIDNISNKPISSISGGQKQRAMLACTLAKDAGLIILDEPTNNLDARGIVLYNNMLDIMLAKGASIIVSTHNLKEASKADLVAILSNKHTINVGHPRDILNSDIILQSFGVEL